MDALNKPLELVCCYAQEDKPYLEDLLKQLRPLEHAGLIRVWHRQKIVPGRPWEEEVTRHLNSAAIILLLISADFIASDYGYEVEIPLALKRQAAGEAQVIPVLLKAVHIETEPFAHLKLLPGNEKPIALWPNREAAFADVVQNIRVVIQTMPGKKNEKKNPPPADDGEADSSADKATGGDIYTSSISDSENIIIGPGGTINNNRGLTTSDLKEIIEVMRENQKNMSESTPTRPFPPVDVLLVTAVPVEVKTVLSLFPRYIRRFGENNTYYDLGKVNGTSIFMVQSEMGSGRPGGSLATLSESIAALSPQAIVLVGIAFGIDQDKQRIGDILVSQQLLDYELQRVGTTASGDQLIFSRGGRPEASPRLLDRFRGASFSWSEPEVQFGLILSGAKLVDHQGFKEQLLAFEPEAIGGEMEGAGLYAAAHRAKVDWIVVKAICDWADGHKSTQKNQYQQLAANNALRFTLHAIQQGGLHR